MAATRWPGLRNQVGITLGEDPVARGPRVRPEKGNPTAE